eukprot:TRINITY_DN1015_c0_g1_i1.p1 TRINITY_DN1015_c0_g1~~TRINITY_DN1015_c0_g1_i1.p1  ORF type:complete len:286 (+),score=65.96 TRINITY_DN1015_c0_g1_i1:94-858(+)
MAAQKRRPGQNKAKAPKDDIKEEEEDTKPVRQPKKKQRKIAQEEHVSDDDYDQPSEDESNELTEQADFVPISKAESKKRKKTGKLNSNSEKGDSRILYVDHIPHGFEEEPMEKFFSQFGDIRRLKICKNKDGKSKHFAFIEFVDEGVVPIAAETMDGYRLMERRLKCKEAEFSKKPNDRFWETGIYNEEVSQVNKRRNLHKGLHDGDLSIEQIEHRNKRAAARAEAKQQKLKNAGIEYQFKAEAPPKGPKLLAL